MEKKLSESKSMVARRIPDNFQTIDQIYNKLIAADADTFKNDL